MANYDGIFSAPNYSHILRLVVNQSSQSIPGNSSIDSWALYAIKNTNYGGYTSIPGPWSVNINGQVWSGTFTHNFSGQPIGYTQLIASGTSSAIVHQSNGTKVTPVSASASSSVWGSASCGGNFTQTPIPRASTPSFSLNPIEAGQTVTITTNRASSGFTHDIEYNFNGTGWHTIAEGVGASTTWDIPLSIINDVPNAVSAVASIRTTTYDGATVIGSPTTVALTITVPTNIVPSLTDITHSEATSGVASAVGAYVQGISTLALAIVGATGAYSSTVVGYKIEVVGQSGATVNAISGTTPQPLALSGTVTLKATVTDSRSRSASYTETINVLAYAPPTLVNVNVERALSDGTPDPDDGNYARININAYVQSLVVSSLEKNNLQYKIYSRLWGTTTWNLREDVDTSGISFNSYDLISAIDLDKSYEVRVQVIDLFATSQIQFTIAVAQVFMDWDASEGLGILKYREQGALDVGGDIYQSGFKVLDESIGEIPSSGSNLDDYVTRGVYHQYTNAGAAAGTNYPVPLAGLLKVIVTTRSPGINYYYQEYWTYYGDGGGQTWRRAGTDGAGTWSDWVKVSRRYGGSRKPAFLARGSSTQAKSGAQSYAKVNFGVELLDVTGNYTPASARFEAPTDGLYEFSFSLVVTTEVGGPEARLYKNGADLYGNLSIGYGALYNSFSSTVPAVLDSGDYIEVWFQNNNGTSFSLDLTRSTFSGHLVDEY